MSWFPPIAVYRKPTFKCEDAINAKANSFPDLQLLNSQLTYYVRGDESRRAQNAIIEFAISLKTRKRNLFCYAFKCGPTVSTLNAILYQCGSPYSLSRSNQWEERRRVFHGTDIPQCTWERDIGIYMYTTCMNLRWVSTAMRGTVLHNVVVLTGGKD